MTETTEKRHVTDLEELMAQVWRSIDRTQRQLDQTQRTVD